jgi:hypothetical protein
VSDDPDTSAHPAAAGDPLEGTAAAAWGRDPAAAERSSWPQWQATSRTGSHWRLTSDAEIQTNATLALLPSGVTTDRPRLEAGTILRLVATYDSTTEADDVVSYYEDYAGLSSRSYEVETGPHAGTRITLPTETYSRYPHAAVFAHTALEPVVRER